MRIDNDFIYDSIVTGHLTSLNHFLSLIENALIAGTIDSVNFYPDSNTPDINPSKRINSLQEFQTWRRERELQFNEINERITNLKRGNL